MAALDVELLDLTRQLSPALLVGFLVIGLLLWLFGAYSHRFWLAALVTVSAGVVGLRASRDFNVQPLVAALLMALSAGVLALSLARIALFLAGGFAAVIVLRAAAPGWNEFVGFLVGGLLGVCLYRVWVMVLSSLVGTLLASYACLSLLDRLCVVDAPAWVGRHGPLLNWGLVVLVILGVVLQFALDRRRANRKEDRRAKKKRDQTPAPAPPPPPPPPPKRWWQIGGRAA